MSERKEIEKLEKDSEMPVGKHKGKLMKDVPEEYYLWLYKEYRKDELKFRLGKMGPVIAYIIRNLDSLTAHHSINTKHNFDKKAFIKGIKKR